MMLMSSFDELLKRLRSTIPYYRFAIVVVSPESIDRCADRIAQQLPGDMISYPGLVCASLASDQRHCWEAVEDVLDRLRPLVKSPAPLTGRVLTGLDFALAAWSRDDVLSFWRGYLHLEKKPARCLVAVMPRACLELLPNVQLREEFEAAGMFLDAAELE
jgi:hypothetical protein